MAALAKADKGTRVGIRATFREVAKPVQRTSEALAREKIPRIGERWPQMRVGVTRKLVYVAPKQKGVRTRGPNPRRRPNLANLLMERAMEPALQRHEALIVAATDRALDVIADDFNRGGPVT